jgi:NADP-dependent 3-hydroxy acid dehydrogenase YdfG
VPADLSTVQGVSALIDDTQWTRMFDINVLATVRATRAALPSLIERRG